MYHSDTADPSIGPEDAMTQTPAASVFTLDTAAAAARAYGDELGEQFFERRAEIRGLLLAAISRKHVLLLGPPGTAKSDLTLAFGAGLGWTTFTLLLTRMTQPEELFGPFSLAALERDEFWRKTDGYLPTAQLGFLDEVFKAGSVTLNTLLSLINERVFDNGGKRHSVPLRSLIGASNELPQQGDELDAFYDRFLLRYWVEPIQDEGNFTDLLISKRGPAPRLDPAALEMLTTASYDVDIEPIIGAVLAIRAKLQQERIRPSDRRWKQAMSLVAASAVLDGRMIANRKDLSVLSDCLWDRPTDRDLIRGVVSKLRNPELAKAEDLLAAIREEIKKVPASDPASGELPQVGAAMAEIMKIAAEGKELSDKSQDPEVKQVVVQIAREAKAFKARALGATTGLKL